MAFWLTVLLIGGLRLAGRQGTLLERAWLAGFLAGMPLIYLAELWRTGGGGWWIELAAVPVFGVLAALGLLRSAWFLGLGILAHGVAWDLWHVGGRVVPTWYAVGCLVADVALGVYVLTHVRVLGPRTQGPG